MSTILNTNSETKELPKPGKRVKGRFVVITADWNSHITHKLRDGALETFKQCGISQGHIITESVPGTVELVNAAAFFLKKPDIEAVIIIGVVIRGDTPHFDYVCRIAAEGTARLNARGDAPVIFGVLTVDNEAQALERAGGALGNKGAEAAMAAIHMANLHAYSVS